MAREKRIETLEDLKSAHDIGALILKAAVDSVIDAGGTLTDLRRLETDKELRRKFGSLIVSEDRAVAPGLVIALDVGWKFTVEEIHDLSVDYGMSVDEINRRSGLNTEKDWEYVGTPPKSEVRVVKVAIGHLNQEWSEEWVPALLAKTGCPLMPSGAWVREAYLVKHPRYDGKGWIGFPDTSSSRWRYRHDGSVCFPSLWDDGKGGWTRDLDWTRGEWDREFRLCLICG